jgi:hypothetical protein
MANEMKVLIAGSRHATLDHGGQEIKKYILELPPNTTVINGGCKGVDMIADYYANKRGLKVIRVDAEWKKHGRAAGPIRNKKMLDLDPDLVVLFHNDLVNGGKGTRNMRDIALKKGVDVIHFEYK